LRVEQYVGQRIRNRREELDMTQEVFGRELGHWLGKPWSRSTVSVAENGGRAFPAAQLVAISHVLRTTVSHLFTPPAGIGEITMPSGAIFPAHMVFAALEATPREDWNLAAIQEILDLLRARTAESHDLVKDLDALITQRVADGGAVSFPHYDSGLSPTPLQPDQEDGSPGATAGSRDDHRT
jgi:transcriptional regulator with XRE-family HTH domain